MAAGTVVSRMSGFVRSALLVAALGTGVHADVFTVANTVPNMLYVLLAGGVFNAVLVPQLVRAMRTHDDGGARFVNSVVTWATLLLGIATVVLVVAAPLLMSALLSPEYGAGVLRTESIVLARYCLPQVFFYGMFVLVGQVLNARGRFGPMMWAPVANNVISVGVLSAYLALYGPIGHSDRLVTLSSGQMALLGLGATAGIAVQLALLVPSLRAAGVRCRPAFDLRGAGLGRTARTGVWMVLLVGANQIAYVVIARLASTGPAAGSQGTGILVYSSAFLVVMVPHSIVTVSLVTALLPVLSRQASEADLGGMAETLRAVLRRSLLVAVPVALLLPIIARPASQVMWGHGATAGRYDAFVPTMSLFGVGFAFFTVHYVVLRGFYAMEQTRTVFVIQCVVAAVNVALAVVLVHSISDPRWTSPALVVAYIGAYAVGAAVSSRALGRRLGVGLLRSEAGFLARVLACAFAASVVALLIRMGAARARGVLPGGSGWLGALVEVGIEAVVATLAFLAAAGAMGIPEAGALIVRLLFRAGLADESRKRGRPTR